ncbi:MAG: SRPBCC family protein [Oscillatoriophycideae cyanobacterium NC_groundwater_1537_Pr4_S-0.65um_50_18]|nr:SRPBCC family protein [Oscillatoriophycideae cyanobacterium NC_groundwater_1537_Pr4_S-0.65um_50_18]
MEEITNQSNQASLSSNSDSSVSETERWASLIGGGTLVLAGLRQGSLRGVLTALAGGTLVHHGVTSKKSIKETVGDAVGANQSIKVEKSVTIQNKSPEELYHFWRNFANLPAFMKHLKSVQVIDLQRSHWVANAPGGATIEWDAEIVNDQENKLISWASIEGSEVDNAGFVRFQSAPAGRGTEVKVVLEYSPIGGILGSAIAKLFGEEPEQQIGDDLRRFKQLMEAGEIATTENQSTGRGRDGTST